MASLLTTQFYSPPAPSPQNNLPPHQTRRRRSPNSLTTLLQTQMRPSGTHEVTWPCGSIATPPTYPAQKHEAEHEACTSWATNPPTPHDPEKFEPTLNGIVYVVCKILRNIMASVAKAESGALFLNCQEAVPICNTLEKMGHYQPPTPVQVDNSTALGIATGTIKQRKSKAMYMRFYWIRDRKNQKNQHILVLGSTNTGDYFTKHFPTAHHLTVRPS